MEPWMSWTAFLTAAGGLAWYYTKDYRTSNVRRGSAQPQATVDATTQPTGRRRNKDNKQSPQKSSSREQSPVGSSTSAELSPTDGSSKKKRKPVKSPLSQTQTAQSATSAPVAAEDDEDAAADERDWAAQLAAAKKGVSLEKKQGSNRPNVAATLTNTSQDVSDMLPESAPAPSSIRITGGEESQQKKQGSKTSKQEEKRNKKQRQNDRKKEEARVQREADEQQRQKLLEQQRRTAREARGEPAKNGLAPAPSTSAWKSSTSATAAPAASTAPLLDTFEQEATSNGSDNEPITSATTPATNASTYDHDGYIRSEEAQREIDSVLHPWEEVGKSKKTKKTKSAQSGSPPPEPTGHVNGSAVEPATTSVAAGIVQQAPAKRENNKPAKSQNKAKATAVNPFAVLDSAQTYFQGQPHEGDSDWAVA